jgi:rSAM/selenodomain-associated transferase 2/rSAM/selenodomain-associated transferase 1
LIIFTRYPTPGTTKTRLIPALGPEGAAELQRKMTEHTLASLSPLQEAGVEIEVRYEGGDEVAMTEWLGDDLLFTPQGAGDLGQRMERAFREAFTAGVHKTVIVGSDCPGLDAPDVREALALLDDNPVVLGPATDGGYYLIAMGSTANDQLIQTLFTGIPWGTGEVLWRTTNALAEVDYDLGLLDERADVDEPGDLIYWEKNREEAGGRKELSHAGLAVSVIIPTFNEEEQIGSLLAHLQDKDVEIIVADGGSTDNTVIFCENAGIKVVTSPRGRALQMNAGAAAATGNIFLFLHADTCLPEGALNEVLETIGHRFVAGAFLFGTDMDTPSMRVIENVAHFRSYRLGIVFGDQSIFSTREAFHRAGGYPEQSIMEDYELWKRLGKVGKKTLIPLQVTTSSRKWTDRGVWRINFINLAVTSLYVLGVGPERLAGWYGKAGRRQEAGGRSNHQT